MFPRKFVLQSSLKHIAVRCTYLRLCFTVILYAISAVYFAGVMVRLMLTLTPVVCVLAAIAFSKTFELYLKDDTKKGDSVDSELEQRARDAKYYDKVRLCVCARRAKYY